MTTTHDGQITRYGSPEFTNEVQHFLEEVLHFEWESTSRPSPGRRWGETALPHTRHCEEWSDEAIQTLSAEGFWIASLRPQ